MLMRLELGLGLAFGRADLDAQGAAGAVLRRDIEEFQALELRSAGFGDLQSRALCSSPAS
jgi:hypothetical protein